MGRVKVRLHMKIPPFRPVSGRRRCAINFAECLERPETLASSRCDDGPGQGPAPHDASTVSTCLFVAEEVELIFQNVWSGLKPWRAADATMGRVKVRLHMTLRPFRPVSWSPKMCNKFCRIFGAA